MSTVKRIYVEKKSPYAVQAKELAGEIRGYLGIKTITNVRVLIRYDIENISGRLKDLLIDAKRKENAVSMQLQEDIKKQYGNIRQEWNDNKKAFEKVIEKAKGAAKVREAAKKAKEHARQISSAESISLIGKLANCSGRKPELN